MNKVIIIGNLGRDPEINRFQQTGDRYCRLNLATSASWKDKNTGERRENTQWHRIVVFGEKLIDVIEKYAKKGTKLCVNGKLQTRKWQDQQGRDCYSTEIVVRGYDCSIQLLGSKGSGGPSPADYDGPTMGDERGDYDDNYGNLPDDELAAREADGRMTGGKQPRGGESGSFL